MARIEASSSVEVYGSIHAGCAKISSASAGKESSMATSIPYGWGLIGGDWHGDVGIIFLPASYAFDGGMLAKRRG